MKKKPGVMIYFELRGMLKLLPDEEKGKLFDAILEYGETGNVPELSPTLRVAWPLIQMRLDADTDRYAVMGMKRRYAAYVRWAKEHHEEPIAYSVWVEGKGQTVNETNFDPTLPYLS